MCHKNDPPVDPEQVREEMRAAVERVRKKFGDSGESSDPEIPPVDSQPELK